MSEKSQNTEIHNSAIVAKSAVIGQGVKIGPYAVVGPQVVLEDHVEVGPHAVVDRRTRVGARSKISAFASIGALPQDLKYRGEDTELIIGTDNQFREYANVSIGTAGGGSKTVIGNNNLFMVYTHVAHDCVVGNNCIFANSVALAGHVHVDDHAVLGGLSAVHQFCRIGSLAMIAGGAMVVQDVPPFVMVHGDRAVPNGLNVVGLRRAGTKAEELAAVKSMYRLLFNENLTVDDAIARMQAEVPDSKWRQAFIDFLGKSERGVCR